MNKLWNKNYILLLQASAVSLIGDLMYSVAIGYWVYEQTGSNSLMGIMSSISMIVSMLLSPFSGSVIDKCNRKLVLIVGDLLQGVIMITIGALAYAGKLTIPGVLVAAFICALGGAFYSPAANTALIDIIPRDDMVRGQSMFSGVNSMTDMVGRAASGALVAFFGVPLVIILNGLSNIYSAISESFISIPRLARQGEAVTVKGILNDCKTAIKTIFSDPCLKILIPSLIVLNLLIAGSFSLMLPFSLEKGLSVEQYGLLMSVWTAASIISVLLLGTIKFSSKARYYIFAIAFTLSCLFLVLAFLSKEFVPICIFFFVGGFLNAAGNAILSASVMLALPESNRGVILGFLSSSSVGGVALSTLLYGFLGDLFPLHILFAIGTTLAIIPMLAVCFNKQTREFIISN